MSRSAGLHYINRKLRARAKGHCVETCMEKCEKMHLMTLSRFDHMMIVIAILYPFSMIPQIIKIYEMGDASSISSLTYGMKFFFVIPWFFYGVFHKSKPIIYANILWFLAYTVILWQTFIY
ncbi:hypothetical protein HOD30_00440 [Candidatus Peregrinibacteria bacterium]|jgi:uncharacterized protein with PQ loop repeat|nr:hypothetical protein [Candidatus Peregrinibacteria bacterium]MBT4631989.1 hypothetical protein [Candidatus Peregrinibacteria bacterium]MBT5516411.1 hypothetical protein [Candidatus Peregrinibacteria bacterium]MBT5823808.1 hypothetical protein [Candidatus Peregrinibacteria bacterium]